ncbi:hypothetical protein ColTof4_03226 [Colletotrichum tofieldiae]|nr:hypothetical protein ColTof3_13359 [Colletotrichum tofieldiae]GKT70803.1 hypothetical protein ColTof4_03226 [Colletotrichum tofieldiae]
MATCSNATVGICSWRPLCLQIRPMKAPLICALPRIATLAMGKAVYGAYCTYDLLRRVTVSPAAGWRLDLENGTYGIQPVQM